MNNKHQHPLALNDNESNCLDHYIMCQSCVTPSRHTLLGWSTHTTLGWSTHNTGLIHTQHWADPHTTPGWSTHNTGLIHILTQHWDDPETIYHWNTATCYDRQGRGVACVGLNQKQYIIKGMTRGTGLHLVTCCSETRIYSFKNNIENRMILS